MVKLTWDERVWEEVLYSEDECGAYTADVLRELRSNLVLLAEQIANKPEASKEPQGSGICDANGDELSWEQLATFRAATCQQLKDRLVTAEADVKHWREARRNAMDAGEMMKKMLDEARAAYEELNRCPDCDGEKQFDSGGTDASGEWIKLPCEACGCTGTLEGYIRETDKLRRLRSELPVLKLPAVGHNETAYGEGWNDEVVRLNPDHKHSMERKDDE